MQGLETLRLRHRQSPEAVLGAFTANIDLSQIDLKKYRAIVTTGIGSSAAHARYLAWLLRTYAALPSWDVPTGAFLVPPVNEAKEQALVVFSQGLSPNARIPLEAAARFGRTILVTAAGAERGERAAALKFAEDAGIVVVTLPVNPEYEVLLRITGPLAGYAVALRMASRCAQTIKSDPKSVTDAMAAASDRAEACLAAADPALFSDPITFVTAGGYSYLTTNLCAKVTEGMFLSPPAAVDALELAHGYLQEASGKPRTFVALTRNSPHDTNLFSHVRASLDPQHRLLEFEAKLPDPLQIFEHETAMNAFVLAAIAARQLDQREWPGKGRDQSLYDIDSVQSIATSPAQSSSPSWETARRLSELTWTEVEEHIKQGTRTVVIPLGATEQHGPHLPLGIDSLIADALAERFCHRVLHSIQAPVIGIGCSSEHSEFAGTLSLTKATLGAILGDVVSSLVRHGFTHVVVFSAHGGNDSALAELKPRLKQFALPARITVVQGIDFIAKIWSDASAREGITPEVSGAHAGEFETSIIAALRPDLIRWSRLTPGMVTLPDDPQTLFYPSLRKHVANGVVGDPRAALAERAERYLSAWVDFLIAAYEETEHVAAGR
jgi:creatinine amidohydrolase/Fe(II)-dependent formamide hydrolase-like protein/fructoselysine-6-P-deglycase FrlB-like protein